MSSDGSDRQVVQCNFIYGTSTVAPGARAYVVYENKGNGHDRVHVLARSRGGRWIYLWVARDQVEDFRVKTLPPEHPLYGDEWRILPADSATSLLALSQSENAQAEQAAAAALHPPTN